VLIDNSWKSGHIHLVPSIQAARLVALHIHAACFVANIKRVLRRLKCHNAPHVDAVALAFIQAKLLQFSNRFDRQGERIDRGGAKHAHLAQRLNVKGHADQLVAFVKNLRDLHRINPSTVLSLELFNPAYWKGKPLETARTGLAKMQQAVRSALAV
jgi:hypothetical protein